MVPNRIFPRDVKMQREFSLFSLFLSTIFLANNMTYGHIVTEHSVQRRTSRLLGPDELERKRIHERVPSVSTYDLLTQYYGFICQHREPGYYGDPHYDCHIFHVCQADGRRETFFCPAWTRFNNDLQICDWQHKVDAFCNALPTLHHASARISRVHAHRPEPLTRMEDHPEVHPAHTGSSFQNKYHNQEYYKPLYDQQDPKLKFLLEDGQASYKPRRPVLYLPQPVLTVIPADPNPDPRSGHYVAETVVKDAGPEYQISISLAEDPPSQLPASDAVGAHEQLQPQPNSQYEPPVQSVHVPPTSDYAILQSPLASHGNGNSHSGIYGSGAEGSSGVPSQAGSGHPTEVDNAQVNTGLPEGYDTGPVIELWIPTKVIRAT